MLTKDRQRAWSVVVMLALSRLAVGCAASGAEAQSDANAMAACARPTDCMVVPRTCCGSCGAATVSDSVAISRAWAATHRYPCTAGAGCPDCSRRADPTLLATCRAGRCRVFPLARSPLVRCAAESDCGLRAAGCCECGATEFVALRRDRFSAYAQLVCDGTAACGACSAQPPGAIAALCVDGRCRVESIGLDGL